MPSIAVIIPCYNEAARLPQQLLLQWVNEQPNVFLFFVNDGSTDNTVQILDELKIAAPDKITIITLPRNKGKGEAVRQGMQSAVQQPFQFVGYLDADLSTDTKEYFRLYQLAIEQDADMVFGSRIKKLGSNIERSPFRHFAGRIIATIIDHQFNLGCYDTQCGAKIFKPEIISSAILSPFYTKWFFDVELFLRIKKSSATINAMEVPLTEWRDKKNSKINFTSIPEITRELFLLLQNY